MRNSLPGKILPTVCLLTGSLYSHLVLADWNRDQGFGDFPPDDIEQKIQAQMNYYKQPKENAATSDSTSGSFDNKPLNSPRLDSRSVDNNWQGSSRAQNYSSQAQPIPSYGNDNRQNQNAPPRGSSFTTGRGSSFNAPWDNKNSDFNSPWNNRGSSSTMPWVGNGANFSAPWGNRGGNRGGNRDSSFSFPWGGNGSSFSDPWNNSGSGFNPWGNSGGYTGDYRGRR